MRPQIAVVVLLDDEIDLFREIVTEWIREGFHVDGAILDLAERVERELPWRDALTT